MSYELIIGEKNINAEIISRNGNQYTVMLDDTEYKLNLIEVEPGIYSLIDDNKSINIELTTDKNDRRKYNISAGYDNFDIEVLDPEAKYAKYRKGADGDDSNIISSPMPGIVVKVLVQEGDEVKADETVIIISAMKMESEYKVKKDRKIIKVLVEEGQVIDSNQPLIEIE